MTEVEQLDTLFPQLLSFVLSSVRGADGTPVTIDVRPIRVGKLAAFIRAVSGLLPAFDDPDNLNITALVMGHTDQVIESLSVEQDENRDLVDQLDLADLVAAVTAVVEVDGDFFVHRLEPALGAAKNKIARLRGPSSARA